jgi:hypothetical protein
MPIVTRVRKEPAADGRHRHIKDVCLEDGSSCSRAEVVRGLDLGQKWFTRGKDGSYAAIKRIQKCPFAGCMLTPYITTAPDHTTTNNLDNLDPC